MPKLSRREDQRSSLRSHPYRRSRVQDGGREALGHPSGFPALEEMARLLTTKEKIVIISGAGISTNAGIPCFKSASKTKLSSKNVFDLTAYSSIESTNLLHERELEIFDLASKEDPQSFELFMEQLAESGRLHRHYTQNIDCRTNKLPELSKRTIHLHGRLDRMRCHIYPDHLVPVEGKDPRELLLKRCPICDEENDRRLLDNTPHSPGIRRGKRSRSVGFLRFDALLYNEADGSDTRITSAFEQDLQQNIDAVIIVGTTLHIPHLQEFTKKLCKRIKSRSRTAELHNDQAMVVWVSKEEPKLEKQLRDLIDFEFIQDCDYFASQISDEFSVFKLETPSPVIDLTVSDAEDGVQPQAQQHSTFDQVKTTTHVIDLTIGSEHCCLCSNVLGEEGDVESYVFQDCGCVICGECVGHVCSLELWCPKCSHRENPQNVQKLIGLECCICYESAGIDTDIERIYTPCSHILCRGCMEEYLKNVGAYSPKRPYCKTVCPDGLESGKFSTVQRGVDIIE